MSEPVIVSGQLAEKDLKRLARLSRGGTVGPTAVYYAGVTAPIISASISLMVRNAADMAGLSAYWQWFLSALVAAFAGISWYLIFIRWSYGVSGDGKDEMAREAEIALLDDVLQVRRGGIETRISWDAVKEVKQHRGHTTVRIRGGDAVIIPASWFNKDKTARKAFTEQLMQKTGS
ncbi:hypothetical protein HY29_10290 [Hyphomonas beringensis]|uniref:YcxB-like C-terminal domain-containing protein n=1 Tax=Hyphomonas beringensis TaxID=1280946 RepID=A0A062UDH7_9PROT|nr:YcxB family protein [Hyphomonas beringensis]KCZ55748.1 hypothetical protein HY29_10290 [Hyphomonas beringensis]